MFIKLPENLLKKLENIETNKRESFCIQSIEKALENIKPQTSTEQTSLFGQTNNTSASLFCDGASRGNPGQAAAGWVMKLDDNEVTGKKALGIQTNNEAEYNGLILGLQEASKHTKSVNIFLDSDLIVNQIQGKYKIKKPELQTLAQEVFSLLNHFESWTISHVPREKNTIADKLANEALDEK